MLQPAATELDLEPAAVSETESQPEQIPVLPPTLKGFAALLVDRLPNKILLVRKAPTEGILVVVSGAPAELRPLVENCLTEHYIENTPQLHLMDSEGFRSLSAFLPAIAALPAPEDACPPPAPAKQ